MISHLQDALDYVIAKPSRMISQGVGMALGSALFVVALGLGQTISAQVNDRFDAFKATTISVDSPSAAPQMVTALDQFISAERRDSASRLDGLISISRLGLARDQEVSVTPAVTVDAGHSLKANVVVADWTLFHTTEAELSGLGLSSIDASTRRDVAVLGRSLALSLGVERPGMLIRYGGSFLEVIGIIENTKRLPDLMSSVVISERAATFASPHQQWAPRAIVRTRQGAGESVAASLALQLRPEEPSALEVVAPVSPEDLQQKVTADVQVLSIGAAVVVLAAGVFAAANLMLLNVAQRRPEIGMRRALGATTRQILGLVLAESMTVGLLSGLLGTVLGLWGLLASCIANRWAPVVSLEVVWIGMAAGVLGGALGGAVPAAVAARVQPADAIRL